MVVQRVDRGPWLPLDFKIRHFPITFLAKKVVFLSSRGKNKISPFLAIPGKFLWATSGKIRYWLPWKKSFRRPWFQATIRNC